MSVDWHCDEITRDIPVTPVYRTTQNVRPLLTRETGFPAKLGREFMAWIRSGEPKTMGKVADAFRTQS